MSVKGVIVEKNAPQGAFDTGADSASAIILNGVATANLVLGTVYKVQSLRDVKLLLLDEAYDTDNSVQVYYHIKEFFEEVNKNNAGAELYIMVVAQTVTLPVMVEDTAGIYGKKLLTDAKSRVKQLAFAYNPTVYTPTILNGLDADVITAIAKGQLLADWAFERVRPCQILLEGKSWTAPASATQDLRAITGVEAPKVSVMIGQDYDQAEKDSLFNKSAAVGTLLGTVANKQVHVNIGYVEEGNLVDVAKGRWVKPAFSSHELIDVHEDDWGILDSKGFIFAQTYANAAGVYMNNDHTCVAIVVDTEGNINEHNIHYGRTIDKAVRTVHAALLPKVKSPQPVDPNTGKLPLSVIGSFKGLAERKLDVDLAGEISGRAVIIDKDSDLLVDKELLVDVEVVPFGSTDTIRVQIGLKSSLS